MESHGIANGEESPEGRMEYSMARIANEFPENRRIYSFKVRRRFFTEDLAQFEAEIIPRARAWVKVWKSRGNCLSVSQFFTLRDVDGVEYWKKFPPEASMKLAEGSGNSSGATSKEETEEERSSRVFYELARLYPEEKRIYITTEAKRFFYHEKLFENKDYISARIEAWKKSWRWDVEGAIIPSFSDFMQMRQFEEETPLEVATREEEERVKAENDRKAKERGEPWWVENLRAEIREKVKEKFNGELNRKMEIVEALAPVAKMFPEGFQDFFEEDVEEVFNEEYSVEAIEENVVEWLEYWEKTGEKPEPFREFLWGLEYRDPSPLWYARSFLKILAENAFAEEFREITEEAVEFVVSSGLYNVAKHMEIYSRAIMWREWWKDHTEEQVSVSEFVISRQFEKKSPVEIEAEGAFARIAKNGEFPEEFQEFKVWDVERFREKNLLPHEAEITSRAVAWNEYWNASGGEGRVGVFRFILEGKWKEKTPFEVEEEEGREKDRADGKKSRKWRAREIAKAFTGKLP